MRSNCTDRALVPAGTLLAVAAGPALGRAALHYADRTVLAAVVASRRPGWRRPAHRVTEFGSPPAVLGCLAAASAWAVRRGVPWPVLGRSVGSFAAGLLVRRTAAEMIRRPRPPQSWWWATPTGFSYPSRHTAWAALGYSAAADLLQRASGPGPAALTLRLVPTAAVAATRVLLAVHWPSDVAAGLAFSWAWRRVDRPARAYQRSASPARPAGRHRLPSTRPSP